MESFAERIPPMRVNYGEVCYARSDWERCTKKHTKTSGEVMLKNVDVHHIIKTRRGQRA